MEIRLDRSRRHAIDADSVRCKLTGKRLGIGRNEGFRGRIDRGTGAAAGQRRNRNGVDDGSTTSRLQCRQQRPRQRHHRCLVEPHDRLIFCIGECGSGKTTKHGAGVVDQHIDLIEKGESILGKLRCPTDCREIGIKQQRPSFGFSRQQEIRQVASRLAPGMDDHLRAAVQELPGHFKADAAAGAGHHDIAIFEQSGMEHEAVLLADSAAGCVIRP